MSPSWSPDGRYVVFSHMDDSTHALGIWDRTTNKTNRVKFPGNTVIGLPTFQFTLTPVTEAAPMPAGTTGGVKTATIQGGGSVEFGVITYDTDGTYEYEVREVNTGQADWTYDTAVYTLTVVVSTDKETGECTATTTYARNGEPVSDMTAMVFTNNFTGELPPTPGPTPTPTPTPTPVTPKTGEPASIAGLLTAIGSAIAAGFLISMFGG